MRTITGDIAIVTDIHFGYKDGHEKWLNLAEETLNKMISHIKKNPSIKNVFILGDLFDNRKHITLPSLNRAVKCIWNMSRLAHVYVILGNHDLFYKNMIQDNSPEIIGHMDNVTLIRECEEVMINGKKCIFAPWLYNLSTYPENTYQAIFGHMDSSVRELHIAAIEHNSSVAKVTEEFAEDINNDPDLHGDETEHNPIASNGNTTLHMMQLLVEGGILFSGHIHQRSENSIMNRKFIFVGAPYQTTMADNQNSHGFYVLDEMFNYEFHDLNAPKFVMVSFSDIVKSGIDNYDFTKLRGCIVKKFLDADVDPITKAKIYQLVEENEPYIEVNSEVKIIEESNDLSIAENVDFSALNSKKFMVDYLNNKVTDDEYNERHVNKNKFIDMVIEKYSNITGE